LRCTHTIHVVSLKRHMVVDELVGAALKRYRSAVVAICKACTRAVPILGPDVQNTLQAIDSIGSPDLPSIERMGSEVETQLEDWGDRAAQYHQTNTEAVKEILVAVARMAGTIGETDQRYADQLGDLSHRLLAAAQLANLVDIRECVTRNATALSETATALMKSSQDSVAGLRAEVVRYETLLRESERRSCLDSLTGLQNRRGIERELQSRIQERKRFCILILDLNGFKKVNDTHGHVAGDDLLKQFAGELNTQCEATDFAGRLGGDEFIVISNRDLEDTGAFLNRIRSWVFGDYKINKGQGFLTAHLTAAAGIAEWDGQESIPSLLSRADQAMYREKTSSDPNNGARQRYFVPA